jgi:hypothetical protein
MYAETAVQKGILCSFWRKMQIFRCPNITQNAGLLQLKYKILLLGVDFLSFSETKAP